MSRALKAMQQRGFGEVVCVLTLFGNIESLRTIRVIVTTAEKLTQDWVISVSGESLRCDMMERGELPAYGFLTPLGLMCHPAR